MCCIDLKGGKKTMLDKHRIVEISSLGSIQMMFLAMLSNQSVLRLLK